MISAVEIRRAEAIASRSGLCDELEALLRPRDPVSGRHIGRPRDLSVSTFLTGLILTAGWGKKLHLRQIHRVLTHDISRTQQDRLGVRFRRRNDPAGAFRRTLTYDHFSRILCALARKVDAREGDYLQSIVDRLLDASVEAGPTPSSDWAIDATGVDTWANGPKGSKADPDAKWGHRTPTPQKSMSKIFYGFDLHGVANLPPRGSDGTTHPVLLTRIIVRPAASDDAEASLAGVDSLLAAGKTVERIYVDRGISYKADARWANELRERGVEQTLDMHASDHGRVDHDGISMIDGWPHCPCVPETLIQIKRPERLTKPDNDNNAELDEFRIRIAERSTYAFRRTRGWKEKKRTGTREERYECPAEAGQVRCPLKKNSMAYPADVPQVLNPPDPSEAPACCTQRTVGVGDDAQGKLRQPNRWGTDDWILDYSRRTYVEGCFALLRNPALGDLHRGLFCILGLIKVTLMLAALVAAMNSRAVAEWATRNELATGDPRHERFDGESPFEELEAATGEPLDNGPPEGATFS